MTARDAIASLDDQGLEFGTLGEHLVYILLRYNADKRGIVRLSMSELAAQLRVNRQTVLKHTGALQERKLLTRQGHGRYRVHAAPWSLRDVARAYLDSLKVGEMWDPNEFARRLYGESVDWAGTDPRVEEVLAYQQKLETAGLLVYDEMSGDNRKAERRAH
jgi:hypothetical protein